MSFGREIKKRVKATVPAVTLVAIAGFFAWSATQGDHGLQAYAGKQDRLRLAQSELSLVNAEMQMWERRVAGLRTTRLDPDTLEERSRAMLNLADPSEVVVMYGPGKKLF